MDFVNQIFQGYIWIDYILIGLVGFFLLGAISFKTKQDKTIKKTKYKQIWKRWFWILFTIFFIRTFLISPFRVPSGSMMPNLEINDLILMNKSAYGINIPFTNFYIFKSKPQVGDIIGLKFPLDNKLLISKRIIGEPGDLVFWNDKKQLFINHILMPEIKKNERMWDGDFLNGGKNSTLTKFETKINNITYDIYKNNEKPAFKKNDIWATFDHELQKTKSPFFTIKMGELINKNEPIKIPKDYYFVMGDNRDHSFDSRYFGFVHEKDIIGKVFYIYLNADCLLYGQKCERNLTGLN